MRSTDPFFSIVALIVAGMLFLALQPGFREQQAWRDEVEGIFERGYVIDVGRLNDLVSSPGTESVIEGEGLATRAVMRATHGYNEGTPGPGVFYTLPAAVSRLFADRRIRVTLTVRTTQEEPADQFMAAFFLFNAPGTGWRPFVPASEFGHHQFEWTPPGEFIDRPALVGIWPSDDGNGQGMELRRILIEVVDPPA